MLVKTFEFVHGSVVVRMCVTNMIMSNNKQSLLEATTVLLLPSLLKLVGKGYLVIVMLEHCWKTTMALKNKNTQIHNIHTHALTQYTHMHACACAHTCKHKHIHTHTYTCTSTRTHTHMHTHTYSHYKISFRCKLAS